MKLTGDAFIKSKTVLWLGWQRVLILFLDRTNTLLNRDLEQG
jgi:hypothetical protein